MKNEKIVIGVTGIIIGIIAVVLVKLGNLNIIYMIN